MADPLGFDVKEFERLALAYLRAGFGGPESSEFARYCIDRAPGIIAAFNERDSLSKVLEAARGVASYTPDPSEYDTDYCQDCELLTRAVRHYDEGKDIANELSERAANARIVEAAKRWAAIASFTGGLDSATGRALYAAVQASDEPKLIPTAQPERFSLRVIEEFLYRGWDFRDTTGHLRRTLRTIAEQLKDSEEPKP
jgi:hypothetical protein